MNTKYKPLLTALLPMLIADFFVFGFYRNVWGNVDVCSDINVWLPYIDPTTLRTIIFPVIGISIAAIAFTYSFLKDKKFLIFVVTKYIISTLLISLPSLFLFALETPSEHINQLVTLLIANWKILPIFLIVSNLIFLVYTIIPKKQKVAVPA